MQTVPYPSKDFKKTVETLVSRHESFNIVVPGSDKKRDIVFDKLEAALHGKGERQSALMRVIRTFQISDFYSAMAIPVDDHMKGGNYRVTYENKEDLVISVIVK
jgi:hypothetical protein